MAEKDTPIPTVEKEPETSSASPERPKSSSSVTNAQWDAMVLILSTVYNYRIDDHDPSKVFRRKVNKSALPDYYDVIKEPMALSTIKAKVNTKEYKSFSEYVRDFALIPFNAQVYNRPDAGAYQDALVIKDLMEREFTKLAIDKVITEADAKLPYLGELPSVDDFDPPPPPVEEADEDEEDDEEDDEADTDEEDSRRKKRGRKPNSKKEKDEDAGETEARKRRGRPPRVDTPTEARIKNIIKGIRKFKDKDGQLMVIHFERLPDKAELPDYYNEIKQPIALDTVKKKLKRKKYNTVEQFMKDVDLIFENAKQYNVDDSIIYKDAVSLQRETKKLAEEEKSRPDSDFVMEDGRIPMPAGILHNGELWKVGDWVHIQNANDLTKPIVAQLYRTWQDKQGHKWVNACWYYRPEQTVHRFDRHFFDHEVMKTGQYRDHPIDDVIDRCFVMFFTRYSRGRPRNFPQDKEVYVCEARYNEENHKLNKIKTWASCLPDEVRDKDYEMDLFDVPRRMKKVPSPIAYLLPETAKETDDLPKPQWGAENAPPKIGAVHKRPRDPKDSPPPEPTPTPPPQVQPEPVIPQPAMPIAPANNSLQGVGYGMASTPVNYQNSIRPSNIAQAQSPRAISTPSHAQHYKQQQPTASPVPFRATQTPAAQHTFPNPTLTPQTSFAHAQQNAQQSYSTPQTYNAAPRQMQSNYNTFTQQAASHYNTPATAAISPAPTPLGAGSSSNRPYNAPQAPQVYCLGDVANSSIPDEIREQFQCDEQGRVLFFTTPPMPARPAHGFSIDQRTEGRLAPPKGEMRLAHSPRYLLAKRKREVEEIARKREANEKEGGWAERARELKRAKREEREEIVGRWAETMARAIEGLEEQLMEATRADAGSGGVRRDVELLEARWDQRKREEGLAEATRRDKEEREERVRALVS